MQLADGFRALLSQWDALETNAPWALPVVVVLLLFTLYVTVIEPNRLQHNVVSVVIRNLPASFEGYRITVLTDVHHLPSVTPKLARAVRMANAGAPGDQAPDVIVLLGDYAASWPNYRRLSKVSYHFALERIGPLLSSLRAPDGVYGVIGNHDYYADAPAVITWLRGCGVHTLVNAHVRIRRGRDELVLAGVDDLQLGTLDAWHGCKDAPPELPVVVLAHNPDSVLVLSTERRADLVLAGHTHGGQVVLPFLGALVRHAKVCGPHTSSGFVPNARTTLFVSRGVGEQVPLRFRCRPEIVTIVLKCGELAQS